MRKYTVCCFESVFSAHETLIEAMVVFKKMVKKFGIENVDIRCSDDNIQTIKIILVKEEK